MQSCINDPIFGVLEISRYYEWQHSAKVLFRPGELIKVTFTWDGLRDDSGHVKDEDVTATLARAHDVYARFQQYEPALRRILALRGYEEDWQHPEGLSRAEFPFEEFLASMTLHSLLFHDHHIFSVIYDYGALFSPQMWYEYLNEDFSLFP